MPAYNNNNNNNHSNNNSMQVVQYWFEVVLTVLVLTPVSSAIVLNAMGKKELAGSLLYSAL